jgi:hypothetical protein
MISKNNKMTGIDKTKTSNLLIRYRPILLWAIFFIIVGFLLLYRLNDIPTLWWDEGWTLSAARNWIEQGHLGNYLDGQPVPPRIPVRNPVEGDH